MKGHKAGLALGAHAAPKVLATSFWQDAPQEGFSDRCIARFGMSFDGGRVEPLAEPSMPKGRPMKRAVFAEHHETQFQTSRKRSYVKSSGSAIAKRVERGANLIA